MPHLTADDGVKLYFGETGSGIPIVLVHEFAGDLRSYEMQMRYFGQRYRCIAYNARGYPPSDVPSDGEKYSQERARDDIRAVLDALKPLGITEMAMPATNERIWRAIREARRAA